MSTNEELLVRIRDLESSIREMKGRADCGHPPTGSLYCALCELATMKAKIAESEAWREAALTGQNNLFTLQSEFIQAAARIKELEAQLEKVVPSHNKLATKQKDWHVREQRLVAALERIISLYVIDNEEAAAADYYNAYDMNTTAKLALRAHKGGADE